MYAHPINYTMLHNTQCIFKMCLHVHVPIVFFFKPKPKTIFVLTFDCLIFLHWCGTIYVYSLYLNAANNIILIMIAMFFIYKIQT